MNLLCKMFGHSWDHCKCVRCGEIRDEDHEWFGCRCINCGKTRDEGHIWNYTGGNTKLCVRTCSRCHKAEKRPHRMVDVPGKCFQECAVCGYKSTPRHSWNGCTCTVCGEKRDDQHDWVRNGCTERCSICGKTRTDESLHEWVLDGCIERCSSCGKERESHDYQFVRKVLHGIRQRRLRLQLLQHAQRLPAISPDGQGPLQVLPVRARKMEHLPAVN